MELFMSNKSDKISTSAIQILDENVFLNTLQIMRIFGITRGTFNKWKRSEGFPEELYLTKRPLWIKEDILKRAKSFSKSNPLWKLTDSH